MSARPCRGPARNHDDPKEAPIVGEPLCETCRRDLIKVIGGLPDAYVEAYLALEPGQRYDVRQEKTHGGGKKPKGAHAPLPLDVEADALMGRILEVVLCWHDVVVAAASLSGVPAHQAVTRRRVVQRTQAVVQRTTFPRLDGETERGEFVVVAPVQVTEPLDRPAPDAGAGVAITSACRTLAAHVDTLLRLPPEPVTRVVAASKVLARESDRRFVAPAAAPPAVQSLARPLLDDDTVGQVRADGRALVIVEIDGVGAALELFALSRDIRRTLGQSRGATVLDRACPNPECGQPGLVLLQGADEVVCGSCGERWGAADWRRLEAVLGTSARRVGEAS